MVAVALYATDPAARRRLERLAAEQDGVTIIGTANSPAALARLLDETRAEAVLAEAQPVLAALLAADPSQETAPASDEAETVLTPREIEVLAAMADGASNKMIARRLGISFHYRQIPRRLDLGEARRRQSHGGGGARRAARPRHAVRAVSPN